MGSSGTKSLTTFKQINVKDITLDIENPRYAEAQMDQNLSLIHI